MAEQDSFIQEVSEEVRRDEMYAVWKKYGFLVVGGVIVAVLGALGYAYWQQSEAAAKARAGSSFIAAGEITDPVDAAEAFKALGETAGYGYPQLAAFRQAAALAESGDREGAVAAYDSVIANSVVDPRWRDLASLRKIMLGADIDDPDALLADLAYLTADDAPWRLVALEFEASVRLRKGDTAGAKTALSAILASPFASEGQRARTAEFLAALGGADDETSDAETSAETETME